MLLGASILSMSVTVSLPEVQRPMSATIATLYELEFVPLAPDLWIESLATTERGPVSWRLVDGCDPELLLDAVAQRALAHVWRHAANHTHGTGLEGGGDLTTARSLLEHYEATEQYGDYQLLLQAVANGLWPRARKHA